MGGGVWALNGLVADGLDGALSCGSTSHAASFELVNRCGTPKNAAYRCILPWFNAEAAETYRYTVGT